MFLWKPREHSWNEPHWDIEREFLEFVDAAVADRDGDLGVELYRRQLYVDHCMYTVAEWGECVRRGDDAERTERLGSDVLILTIILW